MGRRKLKEPNYRLKLWRGKWWIVWTDPATGSGRRLSTGTKDQDAARVHLRQFLADLSKPVIPKEPTVSVIVDAYLAEKEDDWLASSSSSFMRTIKGAIGDLKPENLGEKTYWDARLLTGVSEGSICTETKMLRAVLKFGVRRKYITAAPYIKCPPSSEARTRWLTREEADLLLEACRSDYLYLFIMLGLHTGARKTAILELRWDRVDFGRGLIHYEYRERKKKANKKRATVPMNVLVRAALVKAKEAAQTDWVVEHNGDRIRDISRSFAEAARRAGLKGVTPHTLRHTCATWLVMGGVPIGKIAKWLGDTEATVEKVYAKHAPDYLRDAAEVLAGGQRGLKEVKKA